MKLKLKLFASLLLFLSFTNGISQRILTANDINAKINGIKYKYDTLLGYDKIFLKGYLQTQNYPKSIGNQYFNDTYLTKGNLKSQTFWFKNLALSYDLVGQHLIYQNITPEGVYFCVLKKDLIQEFSIENHRFINITTDSGYAGKAKPGYYELAFEGSDYRLMIKWNKYLTEPNGDKIGETLLEYTYWIVKDKKFYPLKNRWQLVNLFKSKKHELKKFLDDQAILVRSASPSQMVEIFKFYETLNSYASR